MDNFVKHVSLMLCAKFDGSLLTFKVTVSNFWLPFCVHGVYDALSHKNYQQLLSNACYCRGLNRSCKVLEFKSHIFKTWKVLESDLGPRKSWKCE